MPRWEGDTRARLQHAALAVYAEQGYAGATVAQVAARAGLTERTYFRYFPDKREVLFAENDGLLSAALTAVIAAPADAGAWERAQDALKALALELGPRREQLRVRAQVLASAADLQERDVSKHASWVLALQDALKSAGVGPGQAALAAAVAGATFRVAYTTWLSEPDGPGLGVLLEQALQALPRLLEEG